MFCAEAAVELLIGHRSWLLRNDFVEHFIETLDFDDTASETPMALVEWRAPVAAVDSMRLACSSSEGQMLRLAASIAEGVPVDLRETLCGLDKTNAVLGARAVLHASGHGRADLAIGGWSR